MKERDMTIIFAIIGVTMFIVNFFTIMSNIVSLIAIVIVLAPVSFYEYRKYTKNREIEETFPDFLRNISENIKSGMTLTQAIKATKDVDYGKLNPYVKKISSQIDWGVPFNKVLEDFAKNNTPIIKRTVASVIETYRSGGNIAEVFESVGESIMEVNKIRKERASAIYSQMLTGYIIFFVFIGILVALQLFLIPSLVSISSPVGLENTQAASSIYTDIFQWLVLIEGIFSGLVIGKMSQGSLVAGLKHSLIMTFSGYLIILLFV
jgi:flagellar protein FlaJ